MLEDTGERVIPEYMKSENGMLLEHLARYYFALPYATGRVLDIACGTGYGSKVTAKSRRKDVTSVTGVDRDEKTIQYAKGAHYHPHIDFLTGDALDPALPEKLGTFDTIFSFETLEHVPDDRRFLDQLIKMLKPGGKLILSTPFGEGRNEPCGSPFHYFQLTEKEFTDLFKEPRFSFSHVEYFYQFGVCFEREKRPHVQYPIGIAVCTK